jgi:hypothetical protein
MQAQRDRLAAALEELAQCKTKHDLLESKLAAMTIQNQAQDEVCLSINRSHWLCLVIEGNAASRANSAARSCAWPSIRAMRVLTEGEE